MKKVKSMRSHYCGDITSLDIGKDIEISGWVHKRRDHGGVIFLDIRDLHGIVQVVFNPASKEVFDLADSCRSEFVVNVKGSVIPRIEGAINPKMETGEIEIEAKHLLIYSKADTPKFPLDEYQEVSEDIRLKNRFLDLRRPEVSARLIKRAKITSKIRSVLEVNNYNEIETPILTRATPEGARDYLVPSRVHPGDFFALPQSPQLFKQILMVSGMDRYYQIVKCFRDEDLRLDRQPEFTQIDMEMSFVNEKQIFALVEDMIASIYQQTLDIKIETPFAILKYQDAINRFGSDKPDLRFGLELVDVSEVVRSTGFKVFAQALDAGGQVKAINIKNSADSLSRKALDDLTEVAKTYGAKGMAWIKIQQNELQSPIIKFFEKEVLDKLIKTVKGEPGDTIVFSADTPKIVADSLANVRLSAAKLLNLIEENLIKLVWVTEFPLVEYNEEQNRNTAMHHPFTAPLEEDLGKFESNPNEMRARAYDLVLNGNEIGGGSIRIHRRDIQHKMFKLLGIEKEEAELKFGFLLDALQYGAPPHAGIAFGLDRIAMLLAGAPSIREVIAFPKTQKATCLMTQAPSEIDAKQLKELTLKYDLS